MLYRSRFFQFIALSAGLLLSACQMSPQVESLSQYVDPLIGTAHCRWFHIAPGSMPFGMAKPGPSTNGHLGNRSGWEASGYDYRDTSIEGFPLYHENQIGGIVLMPTNGELKTTPGSLDDVNSGYRSTFSHDNEIAQPGYYKVRLEDYNIEAEMTATKRVSFMRYTFPKNDQSHVLFDIGNRQGESGPVLDAEVWITDDNRVEGWVLTEPLYIKKYQPGANLTMYFSAEIGKKPIQFGTFIRDSIVSNSNKTKGIGAGLYLTFSTEENEPIEIKIGQSYTSVENARENMQAETTGLNFEKARELCQAEWETYLGRIRVETANKTDKVKFYTGLYHALLGRGVASDVNGAYPKHDGTVGQIEMKNGKPIHSLYNTDAVWGAQWNLLQLWALAYPDYLSDFISSHLLVYKDSGWMGDAIACSRYISGVGTNLIPLFIVGAYQCGIRDFDVQLGYEASLKNEIDGNDRPFGAGKVDTKKFVEYGYVPHLDSNGRGVAAEAYQFSASHTLEYAYSSWAVAQMARQLGKTEDYETLMNLSKAWERIYDPSLNLIRPRKEDGSFIENFDPMAPWRGFQEGNAYQYTFYVPHAIPELAQKMGEEVLIQRLDSTFTVAQQSIFSGGKEIDAFSGVKFVYNHGNQPCLHIPWIFNEVGRPSLTQKWVRSILNEFYGSDGIHGYGYGQDEDQGQLGAWYVISSLGLFDVKGLTDENPSFSLGSTLFDRVTIQLNATYYEGEQFVIEAKNNSSKTPYVQSFTLNGKPLNGIRLPFSSLVKGGRLDVQMGATPNDIY